jgi:hypothetical protein
MPQKTNSILTNEGHLAILESIQRKYQLDLVDTFKVRSQLGSKVTFGAIATMPTNEKVFITIKGYDKNEWDETSFKKYMASNRLAHKIKANFMPKIIEFTMFERDNIFWNILISAYGGEPISQGRFLKDDDVIIDDQMIGLLRHSVEVIEQSAADVGYYNSQRISMIIKSAFGHRVISVAPEWTSAHCDLHWGNILNGGVLIDWDMFSQAPKGLDAASIVLFSVSNPKIFKRLYREFSDILQTDSGRVATLIEAARILYWMPSEWILYEPNIREAVMLIVNPKKIRWPKQSDCYINEQTTR